MGRHVDLVLQADSRRPVALAKRDDAPMEAAGFRWNDACGASRWEIEIIGKTWYLYWESGELVANRVLKTASGTSIMPMRVFSRPETVADAEAIRANLAGFSGGVA